MNEQAQWQAVLTRDASRDGRFVYGVVTTGIYCRPSCPARRPHRRHVRFFASPAQAERAGLRPCRRCCPDAAANPTHAVVAVACRIIEDYSGERIPLARLASEVGMSPPRLRRAFTRAIGMPPRAYAEACRLRALKHNLRIAPSVTDAVYASGFGSASRVYERASERLGMTPRQYRNGGAGQTITYASFTSPLGLLMMAATERGLCFVQFGEREQDLRDRLEAEFPAAELTRMEPPADEGPFADWMAALSDYLRGESVSVDLPTDLQGTAFQMKVWDYLRRIPRGELRSYKQIAVDLGRPTAVRAVGRAIGANRVGLVIPCHRVIRSGGALGDFRWGSARKRALLELEGSAGKLRS